MISIIRLTNDHLMDCTDLYIQVFNGEPWNDKWTFETAKKRLDDIFLCPNFEGVVYVEEGQVKGAIFGNYEQFYEGVHYNLREMFITTELQGTGIGTNLLNELQVRLSDLGVTEIMLFTSKGNKTFEFYKKNGFCEWNSLVIMGKEI